MANVAIKAKIRAEISRIISSKKSQDLHNLLMKHSDKDRVVPLDIMHTALTLATEKGHVECLNELLEELLEYGHVSELDNNRRNSGLIQAVCDASCKLIELMGKSGSDVNKIRIAMMDVTPLMFAAAHSKIQCMKSLVELGVDLNTLDSERHTALHREVLCRNVISVQLLIDKGANLHSFDKYLYTPLMSAAAKGDLECVQMLLKAGAHVSHVDKDHESALIKAARGHHYECLELLIKAGADVNLVDEENESALFLPDFESRHKFVTLLLEAGAYVNQRNKRDETPLMSAVHNKSNPAKSVKLLIEAGAEVNCADDHRLTVLMRAAEQGNSECVSLLVRTGADVNARDRSNNNALDHAMSTLHRIVYMGGMMEKGTFDSGNRAVKNETNNYLKVLQKGGFDSADRAEKDAKACVKILIKSGADVNNVKHSKRNALMSAASMRCKELVQLLLDAGADVNVRDQPWGPNVIMSAINYDENVAGQSQNNFLDILGIVQMLYKAGAHVNQVNLKNENALWFHLATYSIHCKELAQLLVAAGESVEKPKANHYLDKSYKLPKYLVMKLSKLDLKDLCRNRIRQILLMSSRVNLVYKMSKLDLPKRMRNYLLYNAWVDELPRKVTLDMKI